MHGDDQGVNWVSLFTLKLHCSSILKGRHAFTPCLPPAVSLAHWGASREMLAVSSVTMNVIKGCSVFCDRLLQELPTWEIVHFTAKWEAVCRSTLSHTQQPKNQNHILLSFGWIFFSSKRCCHNFYPPVIFQCRFPLCSFSAAIKEKNYELFHEGYSFILLRMRN